MELGAREAALLLLALLVEQLQLAALAPTNTTKTGIIISISAPPLASPAALSTSKLTFGRRTSQLLLEPSQLHQDHQDHRDHHDNHDNHHLACRLSSRSPLLSPILPPILPRNHTRNGSLMSILLLKQATRSDGNTTSLPIKELHHHLWQRSAVILDRAIQLRPESTDVTSLTDG